MKKIIFLSALFFMFGLGNVAFAGSATISWDANTESDLAGYKVYYGTASRGSVTHPKNGGYPTANTQIVTSGTSKVISNLTENKTYYFSVTAFDKSNNESAYSQEKSKFIPLSNTIPSTSVCTSWTYSSWTTCANNSQTRNILSSYPTNCSGGNPLIDRACTSPSTTDTTRPGISSFTIPTSANSYTVPISTFVATDNVKVTGYCVSEVNSTLDCSWKTTPPTSVTFVAAGKKYYSLYGFAKDAAGNISYRAVDMVYIDATSGS